MKIKSDLSINFFTIYGEARGIARNKKRIIRTKKKKYINYYLELLIKMLSLLIVGYFFFYSKDQLISLLAFIFLVGVLVVYLIKFLAIISIYEYKYKHNFINTITINERGILDESFYGIKMLFKWSKITGVVVGNKSVVILTDTPIYFYFNKKDARKILKTINEYHKNTLVIK